MLRLLFALMTAAVLAVRADPVFDTWASSFTDEWARTKPEQTTQAQYFSGPEQDALDRELTMAIGRTGYGRAAAMKQAALARRGLAELARFDRSGLTAAQRVSAAVIDWSLNDVIRGAEFAPQRFIFEQFNGLHVALVNFLTQTHPVRNAVDVENYLIRLERVATLLDQGIAEARASAAEGVLPPRFIVERTIEQLDQMLRQTPRENVFVATLDKRMGAVTPGISAAQRAEAAAAAEKTAATHIIPAFRRVRAWLAEQLPAARDDAGAWRLPRGADFYRSSLATFTTTTLGPEEIHALGLREVARIEREMDDVLRQLGFRDGSVRERYAALQTTLLPPADPDPRPAMLEQITGIVRDAEKRAAAVFDRRPRAPVVVQREPALTERAAAARYTPPTPDGSRPGVYWIPLANIGPEVVWVGAGARSTAYHEAIPGHHFQLALQQESSELPHFRKTMLFGVVSAYAEGWALYAERLADEFGWYEGDLPARLGYLNLELFRARRLVVDTGLHARKWTRQQAIDYGLPVTEVERYIVWPGQACSYLVGMLRIMELREKARAALGDKFSIKEFHNVVLETGMVPLDVLAQVVDAWIAENK